MAKFKFNLTGLQKVLKDVEGYGKDVKDGVDDELTAGTISINADQKGSTPVNQGVLRNSNHVEVSTYLSKEVSNNASYAGWVEFGTRSKVQIPAGLEEVAARIKTQGGREGNTKSQIYEWCRLKGIPEEAWFAIYRQIMTEGIEAHPFFFPAIQRNIPIIIKRIKKVIKNARR